jgi:membrane associated rhomboid family serine protease
MRTASKRISLSRRRPLMIASATLPGGSLRTSTPPILYQLFETNFGLLNARAHGGGVAFFAHVGGFVFGVLAARLLIASGQASGRSDPAALRAWA